MNVFEIPVHPKADLFPMLSDDELAELAADIGENGLREALVLQEIEGAVYLVDGRNRRAACAKAGVEPEVRYLNGENATDFIYSTNITRRHLTAGQRAMLHALLYPEAKRGGARVKGKSTESTCSREYVSRARAVLGFDDLVAQVVAGSMSLNDANKTAIDRKMASERSQETMADLRVKATDLADLVEEQRMKLDEAMAALRERQRIAKVTRFGEQKVLRDFFDIVEVVGLHPDHLAENQAGYADEFEREVGMSPREAAKRLRALDFSELARALARIS